MTIDEKVAYLGGILKRVGNFSMETFNDRLIFQKTVYLIQAFDIYLGYNNFSWYVRGPYSSELTKIGFKLKDVYDELPQSGRFVEDAVEERFGEFLEFISSTKEDAEYLELLASIHWLKKKNPDKDEDTIIQFLIKRKPELKVERSEHAWNDLKQYVSINS